MKTLKEQDYTINICTDIIEWAKEFYGIPDGAELANEEEGNRAFYAFVSTMCCLLVGIVIRGLKEFE